MAQTINVNLTPGLFMPALHYSQGDVGRQFIINLATSDGTPIPNEATVKMEATKPSGFGFSVSGSLSGSVATFTTTAEMTDECGRFPAEIKLTSDSTVIGTANFWLDGEKDPHPEGTIDGQQGSVIPTLTLLVERAESASQAAIAAQTAAEAAAADAEEHTASVIESWLDEHPEATTTVQDHSLTIDKMVVGTLGYVTPEMFGAKGDGTTNDATAIQNAIDYAITNQVSFKALPKTYAVGSTINVLTPSEAQKNEFFDFGGCTLKAISSIEEVVKVATSNSGFGNDVTENTRVIKDLIIDCDELADYGIYHKMGRNLWYQDCSIQNAKVCGFYADGQAQIDRMFIDRRKYNYQSVGMQFNATDNKINNVRIRDAKTGVVINGASSFLTGVHCWLINSSTVQGSKCFVVNAGNTHMTSCYADTYETAWEINVVAPIFLCNCKLYINPDFYNDYVDATVPVAFDSTGDRLADILNSDLKMFGFEIDSVLYKTVTGHKIKLANGLTSNDIYGPNWNAFASANKAMIDSEVDGAPTVTPRGLTVLRNLYTLSNAMPLVRTPENPTLTVAGTNTITIVKNEITNNGFSTTGYIRINITSHTQATLLSGFPAPLKEQHVIGFLTGATDNVPNKFVHFTINTSGKLNVFGYSASHPLTGEFIIPIEYSVLSK